MHKHTTQLQLHGDAKGTEEMFDIDSKFDSLAAIEGYATDDQVTRLRFHTVRAALWHSSHHRCLQLLTAIALSLPFQF